MDKKITKKIRFEELLDKHPEVIEVLLKKGMHCIGCPMATGETLEQGALMHGLDPDELVKEINEKIAKTKPKKNKRISNKSEGGK
jgi:hybrid cluster-associated redox disulfide protein